MLIHPYIIAIKESYKTESKKLVLILEYASGGDLKERVDSRRGKHFEEW